MDTPENESSSGTRPAFDGSATALTKREYFAAHLFGPVTANLSQYCTMQDKAEHAVDAADALIKALEDKEPGSGGA